MEWSVFLQDQINSVLSLRTKAEKCLCSGCAVWLLYISIKIFQAKVFVVIEDLYLRNCNWAYLFSGPAAACVFPAKSEQVTPPAYCGLNIWPQSNTFQLQPNIFTGQACNAMRKLEFSTKKNLLGIYDCYQCTMCRLGSIFSFQPNKLRHILKCVSWYIIQHIFVPACSVGRKTWFSRKPRVSNSKFGISGSFWPILSVPKIMFLVPENEKRNKF